MKKIIFILGLVLSVWMNMQAFKNETLNYVVSYKWGLIHKEAGEGILSLKEKGDVYEVTLTAKTKPWADKIYMVRDTLIGKIGKKNLKPVSYSRIAHEKGKYGRDDLVYEYTSDSIIGKVTKYREKKDGKIEKSFKRLSSAESSYDMLTVFYYLRTIDYAALKKDEKKTVTVFSGSGKENLTIRYVGEDDVKLTDKTTKKAYHIKFSFTSGKKKKSSEDMDAWISVDSDHIPLLVTGSLPIGQVRCTYVP